MQRFNQFLLDSFMTRTGPAGRVDDVLAWMKERNNAVNVNVHLTDFSALKNWRFNSETGDLEHFSGKFFAIRGLDVKVEGCSGMRSHWQQPIIDQAEVGFLGIIARKIKGTICFLLQAKIEPGNINNVQLSPTLQATRSNYTQVHCGNPPKYLEYFKQARRYRILVDQLQSEQGGRFLHKRNRNIILEISDEIPVYDDFIWLTLGQIKELMGFDNIINMDTRTVFSGLFMGIGDEDGSNKYEADGKYILSPRGMNIWDSLWHRKGMFSLNEILSWLAELKSRYSLQVNTIPLKSISEWNIGNNEIFRDDRLFFRVIGAEITIENREVRSWCQPLVQPEQEGICVLFMKEINGVVHFLVQAKLECGNLDVVEFAPTIQCLTGNYQDEKIHKPPFLEYALSACPEQILFDVYQSEEGGRFYREQNRNMLIAVNDDLDEEIPDNYCWMTLGQLQEFLRFNNYLNIQMRSLLAALDLVKL